jgi:hypothetical protein
MEMVAEEADAPAKADVAPAAALLTPGSANGGGGSGRRERPNRKKERV